MSQLAATWSALPKWAKASALFAAAYALNEAYERVTAKSVSGEVVLITGAGSGIGRLMAIKLAAMQARLILWDVNEAGVMTTGKLVRCCIASRSCPKLLCLHF